MSGVGCQKGVSNKTKAQSCSKYCIQAKHSELTKDPVTEQTAYYKSPVIEISALRSAIPTEALSTIQYAISEIQIAKEDKQKHGV